MPRDRPWRPACLRGSSWPAGRCPGSMATRPLMRYSSRAARAGSPNGTIRCLAPLPSTRTVSAARSTSPRRRPQSSPTRIPVAYRSSRIARSRRPTGLTGSGPASRRSTWLGLSTTGRRLGPRGTPRPAAGSSGTSPRRARNRKAVRSTVAFRAIDAAASPRVRCKRQEPPEQQRVHLRRIGHPGPTGELQKLGHVAPIRPHGVHREPPLVPQMRDKRLQPMPRHRRKPIRVAVADKRAWVALARKPARLALLPDPGCHQACRVRALSVGGLPPGRSFGGVLWAG